MSDGAPNASGGTSGGPGTTTPAGTGLSQLSPTDQSVLCSAICKCQAAPGIGKDGRSLNQVCCSGRLKLLDETLYGTSPYKPEVNYDMSQAPPEPIMDATDPSRAHNWLPGWIRKYWDDPEKERPPFKPNRGMIRRPDVVIVNDPKAPPTQDNIRMVVEIKFPNDTPGEGQMAAYTRIAGNPEKVVLLESSECDCGEVERREAEAAEKTKYAAPIAEALYEMLRMYTRGRVPPLPGRRGPSPAPVPATP